MASVNGDEPVEMEEIAMGPTGSAAVSRQTSIATFTSHSSRRPRAPSRQQSVKEITRSMKRSVADFFGVGEENPEEQQKWFNRSVKLASRNSIGGKVKPELQRAATEDSVFEASSAVGSTSNWNGRPLPTPYDPLAVHKYGRQDSRLSRGSLYRQYSRQVSTASTSRRSLRYQPSLRRRKDSVLKMAYDGIKDAVVSNNNQEATVRRRKSRRKPHAYSRSFTPTSMSSFMDEDFQKSPTIDSVFNSEELLHDDVFFDIPTPSSPLVGGTFNLPVNGSAPHPSSPLGFPPQTELASSLPNRISLHVAVPGNDVDALRNGDHSLLGSGESINTALRSPSGCPRSPSPRYYPPPLLLSQVSYLSDHLDLPEPPALKPTKSGWFISQQLPSPGLTDLTPEPVIPQTIPEIIPETPPPLPPRMYRIAKPVIDNTQYNANRRQIGKGIVGRFFKHSYRTDRMNSEIKAQIDEFDDHRPFFTYWVTFVQILIYIIAVAVYGIAPPGFEETEITGEIMTPRLAVERVSYFEKDNFWIGPRQADLIHLGAKYSPCMRSDANVVDAIKGDIAREKQTACCIRNDGSGCVQSAPDKCSGTLSTFYNWSVAKPGPQGRTSGSVCGQDPRFCHNPLSAGAFIWLDDITRWPICRERSGTMETTPKTDENQHMTCEVTGRPCCIGIQGECIITTREHCFFRRGYFHEEASLCSQVNCMNEICGMIAFWEPETPNQVYRLWTSLFLHAGLLQLLVSVLFQFFIMRDLEKLAGWLRISIIYLGSGVAGSLSSAIFLPYHVEAGPAGSQFGILACLFVEVIHNWYILQNPWWSIIKLGTILLFLFIIGLLPMVDNYAHLVGFIFGFLLAFAFFPHITFGKYDRRRKLIGVVVCLFIAIGLLAFLFVLFYVMPIYKCPYCHYFNCIPFTSKFCKSMEVKIGRTES